MSNLGAPTTILDLFFENCQVPGDPTPSRIEILIHYMNALQQKIYKIFTYRVVPEQANIPQQFSIIVDVLDEKVPDKLYLLSYLHKTIAMINRLKSELATKST